MTTSRSRTPSTPRLRASGPADVIEAVRPTLGQVASPFVPFEPAETVAEAEPDLRAAIESLLGPSAVAVDELVRQSGGATGAVQLILLELDLAGRLDRHAGGKVSIAA